MRKDKVMLLRAFCLTAMALAAPLVAAGARAAIADNVDTAVLTLPEPLASNAGNYGTWGFASFTPRLYLAPATATRAWVGWTDNGGDGHVSRVDGGVVVATHDFNGTPVAGLVAHGADDYAVLVRDPAANVARLLRRTAAGATVWSTPLTNALAGPSDDLGDSRLAYGNGVYAARFTVLGVGGIFDGHYGDQGTFVNDSGVIQAGGWTWGPSHSMAQLVGYHDGAGQMLTLAVSDCYPDKGIVAGTNQMLYLADADCSGKVAVNLGQMATSPTGWLVLFNGRTTSLYAGQGIGLLSLDNALAPTVTWLTATTGVNERDPVMARLGTTAAADRYLIGWRDIGAAQHYLAVMDEQGTIVEGPESVTAAGLGWGNRDDSFRSSPDGGVWWLEGQGGASTLELHTYATYASAVPGVEAASAELRQNVPNPFNPATTIAFDLARSGAVSLVVHDVAGKVVRALLTDEVKSAGRHEIVWNGRDEQGRAMPAGVYVGRLQSAGAASSVRMTLLK